MQLQDKNTSDTRLLSSVVNSPLRRRAGVTASDLGLSPGSPPPTGASGLAAHPGPPPAHAEGLDPPGRAGG